MLLLKIQNIKIISGFTHGEYILFLFLFYFVYPGFMLELFDEHDENMKFLFLFISHFFIIVILHIVYCSFLPFFLVSIYFIILYINDAGREFSHLTCE